MRSNKILLLVLVSVEIGVGGVGRTDCGRSDGSDNRNGTEEDALRPDGHDIYKSSLELQSPGTI